MTPPLHVVCMVDGGRDTQSLMVVCVLTRVSGTLGGEAWGKEGLHRFSSTDSGASYLVSCKQAAQKGAGVNFPSFLASLTVYETHDLINRKPTLDTAASA